MISMWAKNYGRWLYFNLYIDLIAGDYIIIYFLILIISLQKSMFALQMMFQITELGTKLFRWVDFEFGIITYSDSDRFKVHLGIFYDSIHCSAQSYESCKRFFSFETRY